MLHGSELRCLDFFCMWAERTVKGFFLFLHCPGFFEVLSTIGATMEAAVLGTIPLNVSVKFAQVTLCVPVFFAWTVSGVETFLVFVVACASISEFIQGGAVKETLLQGGE